MSNPHVPLFAVATVNDDVLPETTDPDFSFDYVDISSISDFHVSDTLARFTFREAPSRARRLAQPGDIALSTVRTYLRAIAPITEQHADSVFSTGFAIIRPEPSVLNSSFLQYAALSTDFIDSIVSHSNGVSYPAINATDVMRFRIPLPPPETQQRIADYLDRETAEIDAAVADLDRYVGLLERRKFSVLTQALPNPSDKKRTDGSKFASWESRPLWSMFVREKILGFVDEPMVSVFRDRGVVYKDEHDNLNRTAEDKSIYQLIQPGWLAVNRMKAWQGSVGVSEIRGITSGHYICFRPIHGQDHKFIDYLLRSPGYITWYWKHSRGVRPGQAEIDNQWLNGMPILFPSVDVQREITDHLDREIAEIDALIAKSTKLRDLLLQRRSVLITEVVTGRKQV